MSESDQADPVGYASPPKQHQFKKGKSGNPAGRPRKPQARTNKFRASVAELVIAEAYRPVTIRENNEAVTLPMIQAVMRSLGVSAVKGSHRAQIALTNLVQAAETGEIQDSRAIFEAVVDYKIGWNGRFDECDRAGKPRPDPIPHPDDIAVNARTGEVFFNGPFDDAEKATWDKFMERKKDALEEIEYNRKQMKKTKRTPELYERMIAADQRAIDLVDRTFPDEETRRQPDFDIQEWRARQTALQKMREKWRAQRRLETQEPGAAD